MDQKESLEPEVLEALAQHRKIEAIKIIREKRGIGLKEAKEIVDAYEGHSQVEPGFGEVKNNHGLILAIILGVVGFLVYQLIIKR